MLRWVTGSGKTAAFALPLLERLLYRNKRLAATYVLVLTPTRELAVQVRRLQALLRAALPWPVLLGGMMLPWIASSMYDLPAEQTLKRCEIHDKGAACMHFMPPRRGRHRFFDADFQQVLCWCLQVHSMVTKLAQFTDIRAALIVGGLSLSVQAATLRTSPEILAATPASPPPALKHSSGRLVDPHTHPAHLPRDSGGHTGKSSPCSQTFLWTPS